MDLENNIQLKFILQKVENFGQSKTNKQGSDIYENYYITMSLTFYKGPLITDQHG